MHLLPIVRLAGLIFLSTGFARPAEEVVELPAYPVKEHLPLRPLEAWRHAQLGNFEVLSNASDANTTDFLEHFWRFQALFHELFPFARNLSQLPVTLVLCGKGDKFDELIPASVKPNSTLGIASYFATDADQGVIVVDLEHQTLALPTPGTSSAALLNAASSADGNGGPDPFADDGGSVSLDPNQLIYREYVHFQLSRFSPRPPPWLAEGFAQLYSHLDCTATDFQFQKLDQAFGAFFTQRQLMPLGRLFAVSYDSQEYIQSVNSVFSNESFAFVHLCLYSRGGRLLKPFAEFIRRASREPVTEKMFKEIFGQSFDSMAIQIRNHVEGTSYRTDPMPLPVVIKVPATDLRDATDAEVGRIKGETLRLAGRAGAARSELLSPYLRGHSDARLLAGIGFLDRAEANSPIAQRYFTLATQAKVALPGPYVYLVELRLAELTAPGMPPLTVAQANEFFSLLAAAVSQPPPRPDVFRLLAEVWLHTATPPTPENVAPLNGALRLFPQDHALLYAAARAKLRAGLTAEAATLTDQGLRGAVTDDEKARFTELKAQIKG